jgi:hypothetical protein
VLNEEKQKSSRMRKGGVFFVTFFIAEDKESKFKKNNLKNLVLKKRTFKKYLINEILLL